MTTIEYRRGTRQSFIESAAFGLDSDKCLVLSMSERAEGDRVAALSVKLALRDTAFGDDEMAVDIGLKDGIDFIRTLQRMFRQVSAFAPEETEGDAGDEGGNGNG